MEWAKVKTDKLLLIAGIVWSVAGLNILNLGIRAFFEEASLPSAAKLAFGAVAVFVAFHRFVFSGLVSRHSLRIEGISEARSYFWRFFDMKGFAMMAFMMAFGILLRSFGVAPSWFVAFFYSGLGSALFLSGVCFLARYFRGNPAACPFVF